MMLGKIAMPKQGPYLSPIWVGGMVAIVVTLFAVAFLISNANSASSSAISPTGSTGVVSTSPHAQISTNVQAPREELPKLSANQYLMGPMIITVHKVYAVTTEYPEVSTLHYLAIKVTIKKIEESKIELYNLWIADSHNRIAKLALMPSGSKELRDSSIARQLAGRPWLPGQEIEGIAYFEIPNIKGNTAVSWGYGDDGIGFPLKTN